MAKWPTPTREWIQYILGAMRWTSGFEARIGSWPWRSLHSLSAFVFLVFLSCDLGISELVLGRWCWGAAASIQHSHRYATESWKEGSRRCSNIRTEHNYHFSDVFGANDAQRGAAPTDCSWCTIVLPATVRITWANSEKPASAATDVDCCRPTTHSGYMLFLLVILIIIVNVQYAERQQIQ